jgi:hypothetical protein
MSELTLDEQNLQFKWTKGYKIYVFTSHTITGSGIEMWVGQVLPTELPFSTSDILSLFLKERGWKEWHIYEGQSLYYGDPNGSLVYSEEATWTEIWSWLETEYDFRRIEEFEEVA